MNITRAIGKAALKWLLIAAAFIALLSAINWGLSYVPFTPQWQGKRAVAEAKSLKAQVSSLERTAEGNAAIGQAVETYHTREVVYRDSTAQAQTEARNAPDADTPLTDERADRLRRADGILCQSSGLCPAPAADAP